MVEHGPAIRVTPPTLLVDDRLVLTRGTRKIEIRHLGKGHTRGDLVVHLPAEGIVATGDLVVAPVPLVGSDQSSVADWAQTLDRLLALGATTYLPGHGPVLRGDTATAHVIAYRDFLASVDRQARAAIARGETEEKARQSVDVLAFRDRMAGEERLLQILFGIYGKAPAIGAVYREDRESRSAEALGGLPGPQRKRVAFTVAEEGEVEVARRVAMHQMRPAGELDAARGECPVGGVDVGDIEVEGRRRVIELGARGDAEHQPDAAAVEERHGSGGKEKGNSQNIAVKRGGALDVVGVDRDLPDSVQSGLLRLLRVRFHRRLS